MRRGVIDGRVGEFGIRVTANRATAFIFTFTSDDPLSFTTASLWLGGSQVGGNLAGAVEYPMSVTGSAAMVIMPAFPDETYAPLRMTLDGAVVSIGGFWVDPDGSLESTRHVHVLAHAIHVHVNVIGGGGGDGGAVFSVNSKTGVVILTAADVGTLTTAQINDAIAAAISAITAASIGAATSGDITAAINAITPASIGAATAGDLDNVFNIATAAVPRTSGLVVVEAGSDLTTARPAGTAAVYWQFNVGVDVGPAGENIVNADAGDLWFVPDA